MLDNFNKSIKDIQRDIRNKENELTNFVYFLNNANKVLSKIKSCRKKTFKS